MLGDLEVVMIRKWNGLVLLALLLVSQGHAIDVPAGPVSGIWTLEDSPYIVQGHITIEEFSFLIIEPGVQVLFDGPYVLHVDGIIEAVGSSVEPVVFDAASARSSWGHIEIDNGPESGSILSYCVISNGDATQLTPPYLDDGGGIHVAAGADPTLGNLSIQFCQGRNGGGIYHEGSGNISYCIVQHCTALGSGNKGGGIYIAGNGNVLNCQIYNNTATFGGGGIQANDFSGQITTCMIGNNEVVAGHGGGLSIEQGAGSFSSNCIFGNVVGEGSYSDGGGVFFWGTSPVMFSWNTIVGNMSPEGAGITFGYSTVNLDHVILAFNEGDATYDFSSSTVSNDYICVYGNTGSNELVGTMDNIISEHPLFCDYGANDFSLCSDSPCAGPGIGAKGVGCSDCFPATENTSWGRVKSLY